MLKLYEEHIEDNLTVVWKGHDLMKIMGVVIS